VSKVQKIEKQKKPEATMAKSRTTSQLHLLNCLRTEQTIVKGFIFGHH
jgi:hypothetical protein